MPNASFSSVEPARRRFLRSAGTAVAASLVLAACGDDNTPTPVPTVLSLGSGDMGLLSYFLRLKQVQAAFYEKVTTAPPASLPAAELDLLKEILLHKQIQRDYLANLLSQNSQNGLLTGVEISFSSLSLTTRAEVLEAARKFEDLGVAAMNGAGKYFSSTTFLAVASRLASVEARHATAVRDLIQPSSFAASDVVDAEGLGVSSTPTAVVTELNKYVSPLPFSAASLPNS
ncbi:ferritin-like domain-containing protein [Hymenobacter busanensis]|uniref:Ferritin-like domain-containing protein n=1 Tax=Hymenobacter busanensis TaxID=2607656 RepID=A0A7L5A0H3_9BACT|nr:ferritin-like domain-containing protein [Hymenobacter busanensis]KAA9338544.1 ferritin-like domain-containing protein [Hymenobacter busanensis]QHJ09028.1 ferritin-like domain-containing protein [Hymenobacter busanensis]